MLQRCISHLVPYVYKLQEPRQFPVLVMCMEPHVQNTFMFLLLQFENEPPQIFYASSLADLYLYIEQKFELPVTSDLFNRQACHLYVQNVNNLLVKYPLMFTLHHCGTTQKQIYYCIY